MGMAVIVGVSMPVVTFMKRVCVCVCLVYTTKIHNLLLLKKMAKLEL